MSDQPYKVGYRKPPLATRFAPGRSGNPNGRPKGAQSLATIIDQVMKETVTVVENGRKRKVRKLRAMIMSLMNRGLKTGDPKAVATLFTLRPGLKAEAGEQAQTLSDFDQLVIDRYYRQYKPTSDDQQ